MGDCGPLNDYDLSYKSAINGNVGVSLCLHIRK